MEQHINLINGQWQPSNSKAIFTKQSPWGIGETDLAEISQSDVFDFIQALPFSHKAAQKISLWTPEKIVSILKNISDQIQQNREDIAYAESLHQGLPMMMTRASVDSVRQLADDLVKQIQAPDYLPPQPRGLVSVIAPWSLGFYVTGERLLRAIATRNVAVIKPSEHSSVSGMLWGKIIEKTELPPGAVQIFQGDGEFGEILCQHPAVKSVCFTGKTETAKKLLGKLDLFQKKVSCSLSTRNSLVFLPGVSEEQVREALNIFMVGQGQTAWNAGRTFYLESEENALLPVFEDVFSAMIKNGPATGPQDEQNLWTPIIHAKSREKFSALRNQVASEQGQVVMGGEIQGNLIAPLLVKNLPHCSVLQGDEVPIFNVSSVKYPHEVAKWVNNIDLAQAVWIYGDVEKAKKLAHQLQVGRVMINEPWSKAFSLARGEKSSFFGEDPRDLKSPLWGFSPKIFLAN